MCDFNNLVTLNDNASVWCTEHMHFIGNKQSPLANHKCPVIVLIALKMSITFKLITWPSSRTSEIILASQQIGRHN